jgi:hypothetical protein
MNKSWMLVAALAWAGTAMAADIGQIKVSKGDVQIQRGATKQAAKVGMGIQSSDVVLTGADGSAGITFTDNSLMSVGPNSVFAIDRYSFDSTTHSGEFEGSLRRGKIAAVSGKMVKQSPEAMKIRTPSAVMGVRGTEFVVQVDDAAAGRP